jgi:serine/threonine protein kinase
MLHVDEGFDRTNIVWTYTTSDAELIHNLLTEEVNSNAGPAPAIPEELRPKAEQPGGASGGDKRGTPVEAHQLLGLVDQAEGPVYFENYEILNTIGRGGMGIIYRARSRRDGSLVALKVLRTDLLVDPVSVKRFEHEATAASSLDHPNLIRIREFGLSRYGQPYIIMDFLDGVELQTLLSHCEHLDLPIFVNIFTQVCDALAYAHTKGLIHRDLKPGNMMLVKGPTGADVVKIIDFGIAKILCEQNRSNNITTTGEMLGSPAYMSPEQCGGVALDSRSDIYSLGCVMYEAISGLLPFRNESAIGTIMMQVNDRPLPFAQVRPDLSVPEELERIIFKAMEKDPANRYQTAAELSEDLWAFAAMGYPAKNNPDGQDALAEWTFDEEMMPPDMPEAPPPVFEIEKNTLTDRMYTLLRQTEVLSDSVLQIVSEVDKLINDGVVTEAQAVQVIAATQRGIQLVDAVAMVNERKLTLWEALARLEE